MYNVSWMNIRLFTSRFVCSRLPRRSKSHLRVEIVGINLDASCVTLAMDYLNFCSDTRFEDRMKEAENEEEKQAQLAIFWAYALH